MRLNEALKHPYINIKSLCKSFSTCGGCPLTVRWGLRLACPLLSAKPRKPGRKQTQGKEAATQKKNPRELRQPPPHPPSPSTSYTQNMNLTLSSYVALSEKAARSCANSRKLTDSNSRTCSTDGVSAAGAARREEGVAAAAAARRGEEARGQHECQWLVCR